MYDTNQNNQNQEIGAVGGEQRSSAPPEVIQPEKPIQEEKKETKNKIILILAILLILVFLVCAIILFVFPSLLPFNETLKSQYSCVGETFENSVLCPDSDKNLVSDVTTVLSGSCTNIKKCEYICKEGYEYENSVCVKKYCVLSNNLDLAGSIVAISSSGRDTNFGVSPLGATAPYFLIFDNNLLIETAINPYLEKNPDQVVAEWLAGKGVKKIVVSDATTLFESNLNKNKIACLKMSGKISDLVGAGQNLSVYSYASNNCKSVDSISLAGPKLAITTIRPDLNSPISSSPSSIKYFLIFENGKFVEAIKNDFNILSKNFESDIAQMLFKKDVNRVVLGYRNIPLVIELMRPKLECVVATGLVSEVIK
ncbi:MAG: hypothetical protein WC462_02065 [archaeon]